jgi:hypothetical protein
MINDIKEMMRQSLDMMKTGKYTIRKNTTISRKIANDPNYIPDGRQYTEITVEGSIQRSGKGEYQKQVGDVNIRFDIRLNLDIDQPRLAMKDIVIYNNKQYSILKIVDKLETGHIVYYCTLIKS